MKEEILEQIEGLTEAAVESVFVLIDKYIEETPTKLMMLLFRSYLW